MCTDIKIYEVKVPIIFFRHVGFPLRGDGLKLVKLFKGMRATQITKSESGIIYLLRPLYIKIDIAIAHSIVTPTQTRAAMVRLSTSPASTLTIDCKS